MQKLTLHDERTWSLYCGQVQTGSERFWQVRTGVKHYFSSTVSHTVQILPTPKPACSFLTVPRSKLYDPPKWWKQRLITLQLAKGVNWCEVNFSLPYLHRPYVVGKLSISRVRMCNFTRIWHNTKKVTASDSSGMKAIWSAWAGATQKGVHYHFSWPHLDEPYVIGKLSISEA